MPDRIWTDSEAMMSNAATLVACFRLAEGLVPHVSVTFTSFSPASGLVTTPQGTYAFTGLFRLESLLRNVRLPNAPVDPAEYGSL